MSVINEAVFLAIHAEPANSRQRMNLGNELVTCVDPYAYRNTSSAPALPVDRAAALQLLDQLKHVVGASGRLGSKALRPHNYDDFSYLDRTQPWWGFEFETGWRTTEDRRDAIHAAWDIGVNGVTFDGEGEGTYRTEITFAPATMSEVLDGSAPAAQFMQYMNDHPNQVNNTGDTYIGTHVNISFPNFTNDRVVNILNNSIHRLPLLMEEDGRSVNVRKKLFGRGDIYGGFFLRSAPSSGNRWIEGKVFRTTYNMEQFRQYCRTAEALTKIALIAHEHPDQLNGFQIAVTNLLEMVQDPSVEPIFVHNAYLLGSSYRTWLGGGPIDGPNRNLISYEITNHGINPSTDPDSPDTVINLS